MGLNKANLKDLRLHNRRLLIQTVIGSKNPSRISLAGDTGLSPSTVSMLVSELLDEGLLIESGLALDTGGRGRRKLGINPEYGSIAVVEITRDSVGLSLYNMALEEKEPKNIKVCRISGTNRGDGGTLRDIAGNRIFSAVSSMLAEEFNAPAPGSLAGIGLLFREDVLESDLNVVFSTSLSADNISLRDALYTRFKVPVVGEYSMGEALSFIESPEEVRNSVHVAIANSILINITIDGKPLRMNGGKRANITRLIAAADPLRNSALAVRNNGDNPLFRKLTGVLALLCGLFPLDIIFISGLSAKKAGLADRVLRDLELILAPGRPPPVKAIEAPGNSLPGKIALEMRKAILCSG
jgi:hypothetical protein